MSDLHQLHVTKTHLFEDERVDPQFLIQGLLEARKRTIEVLDVIRSQFKEGQDEHQARKVAVCIFRDFGVTKHWHQPYIRFGEGSTSSFHEPLSSHQLKINDIYHLDVGPVWTSESLGLGQGLEYEGDYGNTFIFGENPEAQKMIKALHEVFELVKQHWKEKKCTGENIYQIFKERIENNGFIFIEKVKGHRVGDFPHQKYTRKRLSEIDFIPTHSLWILEAMICHPKKKMGAFFEDLLV